MPTAERRCMSRRFCAAMTRRGRFCGSAPIRMPSMPSAMTSPRSRRWTTTSECSKSRPRGAATRAAAPAPTHAPAWLTAAHRGHVDIVRTLIAAKAPLNHVDDLGRTALLEAVVLGNGGRNHTATVEALVEAGADITLPDRHGTTALQHAPTRGYSQIARILEKP